MEHSVCFLIVNRVYFRDSKGKNKQSPPGSFLGAIKEASSEHPTSLLTSIIRQNKKYLSVFLYTSEGVFWPPTEAK